MVERRSRPRILRVLEKKCWGEFDKSATYPHFANVAGCQPSVP
jgi:hypothetical protein